MCYHAIETCVGPPPYSTLGFSPTRGECEAAVGLLEEIRASPHLELTADAYFSAIAACAVLRKIQSGLGLLREAQDHLDLDAKLSACNSAYFTFSRDAFEACARDGNWRRALDIFHTMKNADSVCVDLILSHLEKHPDLAPDMTAYKLLFDACAKSGDRTTAASVVLDLGRQDSLKLNGETFAAALKASARPTWSFSMICHASKFHSVWSKDGAKLDLHGSSPADAKVIVRHLLQGHRRGLYLHPLRRTNRSEHARPRHTVATQAMQQKGKAFHDAKEEIKSMRLLWVYG